MDIVAKIRDFVEEESKKPTSHYGYEPFHAHFAQVVKNAEELAEKLNVDKEVIMIAAWLHDIGSIMCGRADHHITGAEIAEKKLKEFGYPEEKIELIKKCILNHHGSQQNESITIEEQIIADADTMSTFDNIPGVFKAAFVYENKTQLEAGKSVKEKLIRKWNKLHFEESKKLIKPKFDAAMILFK